MKKIILFILSLLALNVKADMGPPMIIEYQAVVANKDGAICYNDGKKTDIVIPFGEVIDIYWELNGNYINVTYNNKSCDIKASDIKAKQDSFSVNTAGVEKIKETKAVILAKGGLNLRKGPSVPYSKIMTIPQYSVVTLKYKAGTYWYYAEYNGRSGWISGMNQYFGFDNSNILYSYKDVDIYDINDKSKKIGTIKAFTEVSDYIELVQYDGPNFLVNYNGIKGYVYYMPYKVEGEIKILNDVGLYNNNDKKTTKTLNSGKTYKYSIIEYNNDINIFYFPSENGYAILKYNEYELIGDTKNLIKKTGYIGSGLFGEEKVENDTSQEEIIDEQEEIIEDKEEKDEKVNKVEIIIICLLVGILIALSILIIIKLVNMKKDKKVIEVEKD